MVTTELKKDKNHSTPARDAWKDSEPPGMPDAPMSQRTESIILPMIQGLKVLVVGTSKRRREELARALKKHNIQAFATTADEHGYRAALKFNPDVAISEIARPGDPGWWLFKRFHRHPALKWIPALLMTWWEEKNGKEIILLESVFERLGEALTPIRLLEERIAAGRKLSDRVETTGMHSVVDVLSIAGVTGTLSVNDSWNIFELDMQAGAPLAIARRGVDGKEDTGQWAFLQLLLTDSGHWTFRIQETASPAPAPPNLHLPLEALMEWAREQMALLFGPDVSSKNEQMIRSLKVERSLLHDVANTFTGLGRDLLEGLAAGASERELESIIGGKDERIHAEEAMISLVKCGGIFLENSKRIPTLDEQKMAKRVAFILDWIARDHQTESHEEIQQSGKKRKTTTGFYSFSNPGADQVKGNVQKYSARKDTSATVNLGPESQWDPNQPLESTDASWRRQFGEEPEKRISKFLGVVPHDSLAPGASPEDRSRLQMWLAIAIAVVLAALLISGLVIIGAEDPLESDETANYGNQ